LAIETKQNVAEPVVPLSDHESCLGRTVKAATFAGVRKIRDFHEVKDCEVFRQSYENEINIVRGEGAEEYPLRSTLTERISEGNSA
jgi:hypothetical protein